jgi:hypothetical protein
MKEIDGIKWFRMSSPSTSSISICLWVKVYRGYEVWGLSAFVGNTDALNDHFAPHGGEDGLNVILLEIFYVCDAGEVAKPEVFDHLVHGGILARFDLDHFRPLYT